MNVFVDKGRYLSVPFDPAERIVFDRKQGKYHLLRESAARLWEQIGEGGTFELERRDMDDEDDDPVMVLKQAGLVELLDRSARDPHAND